MGACLASQIIVVEQQQLPTRRVSGAVASTTSGGPAHYGIAVPSIYGYGEGQQNPGHLHELEDTARAEGQPPGGALVLAEATLCRHCHRAVEPCETGQRCSASVAAAPAAVRYPIWDPVRDSVVVQPRWQPPTALPRSISVR